MFVILGNEEGQSRKYELYTYERRELKGKIKRGNGGANERGRKLS